MTTRFSTNDTAVQPGRGEVIFRLGAGADATTGGRIAPNEIDEVTSDVRINSDTDPDQQIVNQANTTFTGFTLGTGYSDTSRW